MTEAPYCGCSILSRPLHRQPCQYLEGETWRFADREQPITLDEKMKNLERMRLSAERAVAYMDAIAERKRVKAETDPFLTWPKELPEELL